MKDGIERKLAPGEPEERNIYEAMEAGKQVNRIPMTFGGALDALEADEVVKEALPGDMYRVFMHYKRDEWERYCATVSDWTSRSTSTCSPDMCGIAGLIYADANGGRDVGRDITRMLQSMKHRGPDSTGYALFGPRSGSYVMRFTLADANEPRDFEFADRIRHNRFLVEQRLQRFGAQIHDIEEETEYAYRVTFDYVGDLKQLADLV